MDWETKQQKMGRRLVMFPLPYVGHQNPMLELSNILHNKGFSISVISTTFHSLNPSKHPHFDFHFINDGLSESEASQDVISIANILNEKCAEPLRECLSRILSDDEAVACLITDAMWHFSQDVADGLRLPRIVLRTGNISSFTTFFAFPMLEEKGHLALRDREPEKLIPELPPLRLKDIPRVTEGDQSSLHQLLSNLTTKTKLSKGLIFNAIEETEEHSLTVTRQEFPIPIFPVGPFHKCIQSPPATNLPAEHQATLTWLDKQAPDSALYVSFGSLASVDGTGFIEMAWGLANSNHPFLWVIRPDLVHGSDGSSRLPHGFLEGVCDRGHIVSWAAQKEVLAHPAVGGFWTHCGWNSTLESMCEGVPMICLPCFGDQQVNGRYVSEVWRVGVEMEKGAKREEVETVIRRVMGEKEGKEMRERAACLKKKVNECLLPKGSSYKYMEDLVSLILSF